MPRHSILAGACGTGFSEAGLSCDGVTPMFVPGASQCRAEAVSTHSHGWERTGRASSLVPHRTDGES